MRRTTNLALIGTAVAAVVAATPASAAKTINFVELGDSYYGLFGNLNVKKSGTDAFSFSFDEPGTLKGIAGSFNLSFTETNINITSFSLNGKTFSASPKGFFDFEKFSFDLDAGVNTLLVSYTVPKSSGFFSKGFSAKPSLYGGLLKFTPSTPVPEPTSWAMMIVGVGAAGGLMRRQRKADVTVRFA